MSSVNRVNCEDNVMITIRNRDKEFKLDRDRLCSSIPYFSKMFSGQFLESTTSQVNLNLCERSFEMIMNYISSDFICIDFTNVISLYATCDYLMMDNLLAECYNFFYENFNIEHLPEIFDTIKPTSKLITFSQLNNFISRNFLRISEMKVFQRFSFETVIQILKRDLNIDNEIRVSNAIETWVQYDEENRVKHLPSLIKLVRWKLLPEEQFESIKSKPLFEPFKCSINEMRKSNQYNLPDASRLGSNCLVVVFEVDPKKIGINVQIDQSPWIFIGTFTMDKNLSLNLITDETMIDIIYDSGRKGLRIDLIGRKFNYHQMTGTPTSYYRQLYRYILSANEPKW